MNSGGKHTGMQVRTSQGSGLVEVAAANEVRGDRVQGLGARQGRWPLS